MRKLEVSSGWLVELLREDHPALRKPDLSKFACNYSKEYVDDPKVVPLDISEKYVKWVAK